MDIDATFLPVAEELIDSVFPTAIVYRRDEGSTYNPETGEVTSNSTDYNINAGVLSRGNSEDGGVGGVIELRLWIHHGPAGLPHLPETGDQVIYDGRTYKVVTVDPTYSSKALIASKILCRYN